MGGNDKDHSSRVIMVRVVAFKFSAGKNGLKHSDLLLLKICGQHFMIYIVFVWVNLKEKEKKSKKSRAVFPVL